jgi:hypothetical protein
MGHASALAPAQVKAHLFNGVVEPRKNPLQRSEVTGALSLVTNCWRIGCSVWRAI